ncbi:MAG: restriction endonuclease subunit S [Sulfuricaulis sp.]
MQVNEASASYLAVAEAQNVPPGYKKTEVGVIPGDWRVLPMRACLRGSPEYGINAPAVTFDDSLPAYLRITDISEDGRFQPSPRVSVKHPSAVAFYLHEGELVFARTGASVGKSYLYDPNDGPLVFAGFLIRVAPDPAVLVPAFLSYYVQSKPYWDWVGTMSIRSGQPGINGHEYGTLRLPLPEPKEQRAIAEALSDVDGLLAALDKLITKKRAIKQAAMQQLLTGKTRLPGSAGEWEPKRLGDVADIQSGATPSTHVANYWNGTIPWCTPTDITGTLGKYLSTTERSITEAGLASCAASLLPVGSLLLCSRATIGEVKIATTEICTNQGFKSLVRRSGVFNEFLYYLVLTLKPQMIERSIGSTFLEIGKRDLASIQIKMPKEEEQKAIAAVLSDMDVEITALQQQRDKTRAIKQGMMHQLLTGRVRLIKPAEAA